MEQQDSGVPLDGDIFDGEGNHIGSISIQEVAKILNDVKTGLQLQVMCGGKWHIYKLDRIEDNEDHEPKPIEG